MTGKAGFTITEILVALAIFSVIAVPLTGALHHLLSDAAAGNRFKAVQLAKSEMERVIHQRQSLNTEENHIVYENEGFKVLRDVTGDYLKEIQVRVLRKNKEIYRLFTCLYIPKDNGGI